MHLMSKVRVNHVSDFYIWKYGSQDRGWALICLGIRVCPSYFTVVVLRLIIVCYIYIYTSCHKITLRQKNTCTSIIIMLDQSNCVLIKIHLRYNFEEYPNKSKQTKYLWQLILSNNLYCWIWVQIQVFIKIMK